MSIAPEILASIKPAMPVEPADFVGKCYSQPASYRDRISYGEKTMARISEVATRALEEAWTKSQETHAKNLPALEHNAALRETITAIMKAAGIPDSYSAPKPGSRSYPPKRIRMDAGYLGDLKRNVIVDDGFMHAQFTYARLKADYDAYAKEAEGEKERLAAAKAAEAEAAKKKRRADLDLARLIIRYGLAEDADWPDVLEAVRTKNQYLDLAIAGVQTRGDWSDGFYRVEAALGRFKINDDRDKEIAANLCGCLSGEDGDGRIFRDTTWSYTALLEIVEDKQLVADANLAMENIRD